MSWIELTQNHRRLKDNFSIIREEDRGRLMKAKEEVEKEMNEKKWKIIAQKVQADGGAKYSVSRKTVLNVLRDVLITPGRQPTTPVQEAHGEGRVASAARYRGPRLQHCHLRRCALGRSSLGQWRRR